MSFRFANDKKIYGFNSRQELLEFILPQKKILIAVGVEKILNKNNKLTQIINENVAYCDGVGSVMVLKKKGLNSIKIPGAEFWLDIVKECYNSKTFYLIGSKLEIINQVVSKLEKDFPGIDILNYRDGYFEDEDITEIEQDIKEKKPDIVFVALGSPKQEFLMSRFIKTHKALYMGLGGSFDLYTGSVKEVPLFWKKIFRWEGLYRSFNDFKNIKRWKRQLIAFKFFYKLLTNKI
ncbi:WecB/TagA/CpsF family glycosyltransferase [Aquimarina latercula]|uniref:WecB/TagA/CpsF family glycosyltransferase n=1 Tax=Aquimarina latercula TaxID=987 RepID=UPI00040C8DA3|nr:WecB/TagA/CpsF family glycosyltransferase [Aquimarina latercula]